MKNFIDNSNDNEFQLIKSRFFFLNADYMLHKEALIKLLKNKINIYYLHCNPRKNELYEFNLKNIIGTTTNIMKKK
ncbi:hypothetical protein BpHYR1_049741 [Brachionus plicatilis]|uniref:Uncharacterized protein n=1 Tax=Brachionus plicatilis TaxID=10195 RepID=A0A3M7PZ91_BRAPC|nr:hypothetical protein BpHYR1_049741 [Brachionus plicatilis]